MRYAEKTPLTRVTVERGAVFVDSGSKDVRVIVAVWTSDEEAERHAEKIREAIALNVDAQDPHSS